MKDMFTKLHWTRPRKKPKYNLKYLVTTEDKKNLFSKNDTSNWSYKLYTNTKTIDDTIPFDHMNKLPRRYNKLLFKKSETRMKV